MNLTIEETKMITPKLWSDISSSILRFSEKTRRNINVHSIKGSVYGISFDENNNLHNDFHHIAVNIDLYYKISRTTKVESFSMSMFYNKGNLHRDGLPAVIISNNSTNLHEEMWIDGIIDTSNRYTIMTSDGVTKYFKDKILHRDGDLPAIIERNGSKWYYKYGKLHRDNGLPAVEYSNGGKRWYVNDVLYRGGNLPPIILSDDTRYLYKNGILSEV